MRLTIAGRAPWSCAVERTGYADFFELRARGALPNETTNYVPIILAMTIMAKNAQAYGLDQIVADPAIEYDTVRTVSPTNLALIGDLTGTPVPELLQLNPALLRSLAPADFEVRVPKGMGEQVSAALDVVPAEKRAAWRVHRVEAGESMAVIARSFNLTAKQIASANNLQDAEPAAGDQLLIPAVYHETATPLRVPAVRAKGSAPHTASNTAVAAKRAPAKTQNASLSAKTQNASVKAPAKASVAGSAMHRPSGVAIAQAKERTRPLNP